MSANETEKSLNTETLESINELNERLDEKNSSLIPSFGYKSMMTLAAAMISFGQFNDTRELLITLYEETTTNFTHAIEYDKLKELAVGRTISFTEGIFGAPEVIKKSSYKEGLIYQYYNIDKAVLCILNLDGRVAGFTVIPREDDFSPQLNYVTDTLGESTYVNAGDYSGDIYLDVSNLIYYAESQDLGKSYIFLKKVTGFVEYGRLAVDEQSQDSKALIIAMNDNILAQNITAFEQQITDFRQSQKANFYAFTELDPSLIADSLLTRFEFQTYFEKNEE